MNSNIPQQRKRIEIRKRTFVQRYPKTVFWTSVTTGLLVFFSRPIYDAFFRTEFAPPRLPKGVAGNKKIPDDV